MDKQLTPDECAAIRDRVAAFCTAKMDARMRMSCQTERMRQMVDDFNTLINELARLHDLLAVPAQLVMEVS